MKHNEDCIKAQAEAQAAISAYEKAWPNYLDYDALLVWLFTECNDAEEQACSD